ncbi:MAG: amidase family protein [Gammaproteobacteria bacterium]|nr:amidase family protein [Gammaproteobacteria bacterium]
MAGPDYIDPNCVDAPFRYRQDVALADLRVGFHTDNGIKRPDPDIRSTVEHACDLLRDGGFTPSEAKPSGIEMADFIMSRVFSADGGELIESLLEDSRTSTPSPRVAASLAHSGPTISQREFAQTITLWDNYRSSMLAYFKDFDILICPVNAHTAIPHGDEEDMAAYSYTTAYNLTGWPGVVIRAGTSDDGLPIGLQILARPFREDECLAVAGWLSDRIGEFAAPQVTAVNR